MADSLFLAFHKYHCKKQIVHTSHPQRLFSTIKQNLHRQLCLIGLKGGERRRRGPFKWWFTLQFYRCSVNLRITWDADTAPSLELQALLLLSCKTPHLCPPACLGFHCLQSGLSKFSPTQFGGQTTLQRLGLHLGFERACAMQGWHIWDQSTAGPPGAI